MSAAQALVSGLLASTPSVRPSSGGSAAAERSDTSFRDTLDEASRSREAPEGEARQPGAERARKDDGAGSEDAAGDDREGASRDGERAQPSRTEPTSAAELALMLVQLGGTVAVAEGDAEFVAKGAPAAAAVAVVMPVEQAEEAGPPLPGATGEDGEPLDAAKILALLKSGSATAAAAATAVDKIDVKVTVVGQETHLALAPPPKDVATALSTAEAATGDAVVPLQGGDGKAAALSLAANEAVRPARLRDGAASTETEAKANTGSAVRGGPIGESWRESGNTALADQGIAGQEDRQSEGRGASGGSSQQQGTATFMSMLAGAAPQAVRDTVEVGVDVAAVSDQIATEVRAELKAGGIGSEGADGRVKILNLELKPANLGSVTVRIALKDNVVSVHIEAQRHETLAVIEREREALGAALQSAGYAVDGITAGPQSDAGRTLGSVLSGAAPQSAPGGQQGQGSQGQFGNSAGGQGGSSQAGSGQSGQRFAPDAKDTNGGGVRRAADGLYV